MVIDGSSTCGIGYVLFKWLNDEDPSQGATIIQAGSSLLPLNLGFLPVDSELAGLQYACKACHYYLLHCPKLRLLSDNSGLIQMLQKDICSIRNPRHHRILSSLQHLVFHEVIHIPGQLNVLADALSRLARFVRLEGEELSVV